MADINTKSKIDNGLLVVILLGVIFFVAYSYLASTLPGANINQPEPILNSPDETANLFYTRQFAAHTRLSFIDPANFIAKDLVTPRSMRVINSATVPAGFIGLPIIYGTLAKLTGVAAIPFFTPMLAVVGVVFFYLLIKLIFDPAVALFSASLAYLFPGYWYYAEKGLMPNVVFAVFFIIALYYFLKSFNREKLLFYLLFGFFTALALMVRTSEIVWLGPLFLILLISNWKKINWPYLFGSLAIFLAVFSSIFYYNLQIYGSPFSVGYSLKYNLAENNILTQGLSLVQQIFLPFGLNIPLALKNFYNYTFVIFPLWSVLILSGFVTVLFHQLFMAKKFWHQKKFFSYIALLALVGMYLIFYYGSWLFYDNPDPGAITIGTSYIRYWLLIYLFSLPFLAGALNILLKRFTIAKSAVIIFIFTCLALISYKTVMLNGTESIVKVAKNLKNYQILSELVNEQTEPNAVIVAGRMDKVFFPSRSVIFKLNVSADYDKIKELIQNGFPVYNFDFTLLPENFAYANTNTYSQYGLKLGKEKLKFGNQSLYPIQKNDQ
ncbi:MAG: glycosyltransferase family 39 protein [Patescibacteria group bacterium]|jgi:hypothetical protein